MIRADRRGGLRHGGEVPEGGGRERPGPPETSQRSAARWLSWGRLACLALTGLAVFLVVRRIDGEAFRVALGQVRPGWFVLSVGLCGAAFVLAALRWHLALGLTDCAVHLAASLRLTLIGHYLVLVLFGGLPGDVAKSSVYARWYRHRFPEVFAASPLDRLLGFGGLVLFGAGAFGFASGCGGWAGLPALAWHWPAHRTWMLLGAAMLGTPLLLLWKPRRESAPLRLLRSMQAGGVRLLRQPRLAGGGLACGVAVQLLLSGVLASNVLAISGPDLPWVRMLWTFPVISLLGALPVTVAGLGVREGSALLLLGLYQVSAAEAVAASLLSLAANLFWGGVGAALFWGEDRFQQRAAHKPLAGTITVVLPTGLDAGGVVAAVGRARALPEVCEVIVTDGPKGKCLRWGAQEKARGAPSDAPVPGTELREGPAAAAGDAVLLLSPKTWLPTGAGKAVLNCLRDQGVAGGGFWRVTGERAPWPIGSRWWRGLRLVLRRPIRRDHGLFVRKEALERIGGVQALLVLDDAELSRQLQKQGRLALADATVGTLA